MINDFIMVIGLIDDVCYLPSLNGLTVVAHTQLYVRVYVESTQGSHSWKLFDPFL